MLETVRLRLRALAPLVEHRKGSPVFTDFRDEMGDESEIDLPGFTDPISFERFKEKVRAFLRKHQDRESIQKLRLNEPLTEADLDDLEQVLLESGAGTEQTIEKAAEGGLGLFVRSLVGLDREAAKAVLNEFLAGKTLSANQIEFVNMVVDYLTEHGVMEPKALYESPFTDINPMGPEGLFESETVDQLVKALQTVRSRAIPVGAAAV
jgi:type I restriction enzyme, R subunit